MVGRFNLYFLYLTTAYNFTELAVLAGTLFAFSPGIVNRLCGGSNELVKRKFVKMATEIVSMQQVIITVVFLSCLLGLLLFLRMKGGFIRANLQKGHRIKVIEETAISPSERLRLISIDNHNFVMLSGKNIQPSLVPLQTTSPGFAQQPAAFSDHMTAALPDDGIAPLELTTPVTPAPSLRRTTSWEDGHQNMDKETMGPDEVAAFAAKFKGWRKN